MDFPSNADFTKKTEKKVIFPLETEQSIISSTLAGDYKYAEEDLHKVICSNLSALRQSTRLFFEFKAVMKLFFRRLLSAMNETEAEVFPQGDEIYTELDVLDDPDLLTELILKLYCEVADYARRSKREENNLTAGVLKYIKAYYMQDLSLEKIADAFHVTPYYISRLFKRQIGINYRDYLNRYRITKAKRMMLQNPKIYIKEASKAVGFNSMETFHRVFKRLEGVTPREYVRRLQSKKKNETE